MQNNQPEPEPETDPLWKIGKIVLKVGISFVMAVIFGRIPDPRDLT